jgi:hypothetical protein
MMSSLAPFHAYGGFVVEHGCVWSFDGNCVLRGVRRDIAMDVHDARGRRVLFMRYSLDARDRIEVRSGSGRRLGTLHERSIEDGKRRPLLEVAPLHLIPGDVTIVRVAPRRPRRVATIQRTWDDRNERRLLYSVTYESRSVDADERALVLALAMNSAPSHQ